EPPSRATGATKTLDTRIHPELAVRNVAVVLRGGIMAGEGLERCSRDELAVLVREYLMAGHLIDRAGMPHVMAALGPGEFGPVAIEEWMGASPIYSRRMQQALRFEGDSVETIFKGMQFDIGAPPQFLDFRYQL